MDKNNKLTIKKGVESAIPIVLGFIPVAIAFGVMARNIDLSLVDTGLFSMMVYAGASQFMALDLIHAGINMGSIILTTFLLNLRHLVMSAYISTKFVDIRPTHYPIVAFGITDETFSLFSFSSEKLNLLFVLLVNSMGYFSWVTGTILGYLLGEILPVSLQASLGIGLYGMFAALLVPQFKGKKNNLVVAILSAIIYVFISKIHLFKMGWDIVVSIIISSLIGAIFFGDSEGETTND